MKFYKVEVQPLKCIIACEDVTDVNKLLPLAKKPVIEAIESLTEFADTRLKITELSEDEIAATGLVK